MEPRRIDEINLALKIAHLEDEIAMREQQVGNKSRQAINLLGDVIATNLKYGLIDLGDEVLSADQKPQESLEVQD